MKLEELEEGDRILFEGRKKPLEIKEEIEDGVIVEGPSGGDYEIYSENDAILYCRKGNRRYSSYCENLRKVGEWERNENSWRHSDSGRELSLEKNEIEKWIIASGEIDVEKEMDVPKYGFSDREVAEKEVSKFIEKNPEG
ncbi:MAG: hypothetical protein ABEJ56_02370 [Candidatus Nanohaloarchaea archaeon]